MKQKDKELLLKDLCGRLPYGVKCKVSYNSGVINDADATLYGMDKDGFLMFDEISGDHREFLCKPYLFPLSSMTEKQEEEYGKCYDIDLANSTKNLYDRLDGKDVINGYPMYNHIDWCNQNHIDYRGLIEKGLAIDATGLNIYNYGTKR